MRQVVAKRIRRGAAKIIHKMVETGQMKQDPMTLNRSYKTLVRRMKELHKTQFRPSPKTGIDKRTLKRLKRKYKK